MALLINMGLPFTALAGILFFRERFTYGKILALIAAAAGAFLVTTEGDLSSLAGGNWVGDLYSLTAMLSWSVYFIIFKKYLARDKEIFLVNFGMLLTTAVVVNLAALLLEGPISFSWSGELSLMIVYLALFCSLFPYILWNAGIRHISVPVSAILLMMEIIVAAILAYFIFGDVMSPLGYVGGGLIMLSALLILR